MGRIKAARSWQQLQVIVDANARAMNHLHVSAVVTHMAQLHACSSGGSGRSDGPVRRRLELSRPPLGHHIAMGGRDSYGGSSPDDSASAAAVAAAAARSAASQQPGALTPLQQPLPAAPRHQQQQQHHHQLQGRGVARAASSSAYESREAFLRRMERAVLAHLRDFRGRQLANTLWAVAKLGYRPSRQWLDAVLTASRAQLQQQLRQADAGGGHHGVGFEPQHLANTLYALAMLGVTPSGDWLNLFFAAVDRQLHGFGPAELAHLCYAGGRLRLSPGRRLLGGFMHHSGLHMAQYGIRELSLLLYGLVHMGATVESYDWMRGFRIRTMEVVILSGALPRARLEQLVPRLNLPLAAAVAAQLTPARGEEAGDSRDGQGQEQRGRGGRRGRRRDGGAAQAAMVVQYLPAVLLSMGTAGYYPPPVFLEVVLGALGGGRSAGGSTAGGAASASWQGASPRALGPVGLSSLMLALAYMKYRPHPRWFAGVWRAVMSSLDSFDPQQTCNVLWAVAQLQQGPGADPRLLPRRDVSRLLCAVASRLPEHSDSEVLAALQAAALIHNQRRQFQQQPYQQQETQQQQQELELEGVASSSGAGLPPSQQAAREAEAEASFPRRDWLELMETELYGRLHQLKPSELGAALQHWAALGHRPNRLWMARWAEAAAPAVATAMDAVAAVANGGALRPAGLSFEQLCRMTHAAARLGFRPPAPLRSALLQATGAYLSAIVAADATADAEGPLESETQPLPPSRLERMVGAGSVSWLLWALALLDVRPSDEWMASYMGAMAAVMRRAQQQGASGAAEEEAEREGAVLLGSGMDAMGAGPGLAGWAEAGDRREGFSARQLSLVVWALARLRYDPGPQWMQLFVERSQPLVVTPAPAAPAASAAAPVAVVAVARQIAATAPEPVVAAAVQGTEALSSAPALAAATVSTAQASSAEAAPAAVNAVAEVFPDVQGAAPARASAAAAPVVAVAATSAEAAAAQPTAQSAPASQSLDRPSTASTAGASIIGSSSSPSTSTSSRSSTGTGGAGGSGMGGFKPVLDFSRVILQGLTAWAVTQISGAEKQAPAGSAGKGENQAGDGLEAAAARRKRGGLARKRI
ncbi:hypothetical protein HXX76_006855 [Chlamydomonas incerta]|uniref:Tbc2 translation factor, chloroplastic n=1 Tax=Chlamydomonas incerta TaxID=51695 RepID=A0A835SYS7_CHLIN|nr:hypothetical protein HXX76_006855 [Chlamydomonas incerta]|eukprot:KAG2435653.1 hypothetical protein HXX76_006855 [Chlamydomonas incerta]